MYTQRCASAKYTRIVLTIAAILLAGMSATHFAQAGLNGRLLNVFNDPLFTDQNQLGIEKSIFERMFAPPIIYFAIAGAAQIAFNIFYLVILWQCVKLTRNKMGLMVSLLILELAMNSAIAVWSAMQWTVLEGFWNEYFDLTDEQLSFLKDLNKVWGNLHSAILSLFNVSKAETLLSYVLVLPAIIVKLFFFLDKTSSYAFVDTNDIGSNPSAQNLPPPTTDRNIKIAQ